MFCTRGFAYVFYLNFTMTLIDRYYNPQFVQRKKERKRNEFLRIHEILSKVKQTIICREILNIRSSYVLLHPTIRHRMIISGQNEVMAREHTGERHT